MDTKAIRYFAEVARTKSYPRAAEKLCMTPQGLQQAIKKLEKEVGVPLLDTSNGITLTEYGEQYFVCAETILSLYDDTVYQIRNRYQHERGLIYVKPSRGRNAFFTDDDVALFNATNESGAKVQILDPGADYVCKLALSDGYADFSFLLKSNTEDDFERIPVYSDSLLLWGKRELLPASGPVSKEYLSGKTIAGVMYDDLLKYFTECGATPLPVPEIFDAYVLAHRGEALALTMHHYEHVIEDDRYTDARLQDLTISIELAHLKNRHLSAQDIEFINFVKSRANC